MVFVFYITRWEGGLNINSETNNISDYLIGNIKASLVGRSEKKFTYIIGSNGTGKSRLLRALADKLNVVDDSPPSSILCISNSVFDRFNLKAANKAIYLGQRTVGNAIFHANVSRWMIKWACEIQSKIPNFYDSINSKFEWGCSVSIEKLKVDYSNELDWVSNSIDKRKLGKSGSVEGLFKAAEKKFLRDSIGKTIPVSNLPKVGLDCLLKLTRLNCAAIDFLLEKKIEKIEEGQPLKYEKKDFKFSDLSSGEQNRLLLAFKIVANYSDCCLILIDEPEVSLHLHWQMEFHGFIKEVLPPEKKWHVVVATHSPLIVSEAEKDKTTNPIVIAHALNSEDVDNMVYDVASASQQQGYDWVVLDYFSTATYNSKTIEEEMALALIDGEFDYEYRENKLKRLRSVKGLTDAESRMLDTALGLLRNYEGDLCSKQLISQKKM